MVYKSSILFVALATGACASENPFAIEKNVQKIEQEENALLQALAKEQKTLKDEEDASLKESISETKIPHVKSEISSELPETERDQEIEVEVPVVKAGMIESASQEVTHVTAETEKLVPPFVEKVSRQVEGEEAIEESKESKTKEPTPQKEEISEPITIRKTVRKQETETVNKPKISKMESSVKEQSVEKQITKKPAISNEVFEQPNRVENNLTERNITFEQELLEAIKSVQD